MLVLLLQICITFGADSKQLDEIEATSFADYYVNQIHGQILDKPNDETKQDQFTNPNCEEKAKFIEVHILAIEIVFFKLTQNFEKSFGCLLLFRDDRGS